MYKKKYKLIICIPVLNEAKNIPHVFDNIRISLAHTNIEYKCIFIDNGSTDQTNNVLEKMHSKFKTLSFIKLHNKGLGLAYAAAFNYIIMHNLDYDGILTMDGDGTHEASYIPAFVQNIVQNSLVIGSRFKSGGGLSDKIAKWRHFTGSGSSFFLKLAYFGKLHAVDCSGGFRLYSKEAISIIAGINLSKYPNFVFQLAALYWLRKSNIKIIEIPVILKERKYGRSNMKIIQYVWEIIQFTFTHRKI